MILPFADTEALEENQDEEIYIPREYEINFETGQLTGKIVEGYDAVLVWAWLALQTSRYRYYIYSSDYGQEYENLVGKNYSKELTESEIERMTEECLTVNPYISGITNFECTKNEDKITVSFTIKTDFGDGEVKLEV